jgi:DNA adenine methylase
MAARNPNEFLGVALDRALQAGSRPIVKNRAIAERIDLVATNAQNRACVRFVMACALAKASRLEVDIRKPYTEIGTPDCYSGRTYDERYVGPFITYNRLPCNSTTAFLTPAFRNRNAVLTPDMNLVGRPPSVYKASLQLLTDVQTGKAAAQDILAETVRLLLIMRGDADQRLSSLLAGFRQAGSETTLSAEGIVSLIEKHLDLRRSSRLPVLVVAAAYRAAEEQLGERVLALHGHNAADKQTGALGDLEITVVGDDRVVTSYEMKTRRVEMGDIDIAIRKIAQSEEQIDNYIFITTQEIEKEVQEYAISMYEETGGIEITVLDCIAFLRHFLHLFHRLRTDFLDEYQNALLTEPESAVSSSLKEAFLAMRQAAEG